MTKSQWACAVVAGVAWCASAQPTDLFYDDLDPVSHAEVKTFISMYTHMLIHGEPAEGAEDFSFTRPEANSPLFQPYIAYVRTLAKIKGGGEGPFFGHLVSPSDVATYSDGTVVFTSTSEPLPTINHLSAIAASGGTAQAIVGGGTLQSVGLGVQPVEADPPYVSPLDPPEYETWMDDLASLAANVASTLDPAMDAKYMLLGQPTNAERLRASLDSWLDLHRPNDAGLGSYVVHGMFGRFGALPTVVLSYADGYLLVDGIDGTMAGPYLYEDEVDLMPLVAQRSQHNGVSVVGTVDMNNSSVVLLARRKQTRPPRHYIPNGACPGNPGCFNPRLPQGSPTGTPYYGCVPRPLPPACVCTATGNYVPGPNAPAGSPASVKTDIIFTSPIGPDGDCPNNMTAPPNLIQGANCTQYWYHDLPV